jgi:hypothetical protein
VIYLLGSTPGWEIPELFVELNGEFSSTLGLITEGNNLSNGDEWFNM